MMTTTSQRSRSSSMIPLVLLFQFLILIWLPCCCCGDSSFFDSAWQAHRQKPVREPDILRKPLQQQQQQQEEEEEECTIINPSDSSSSSCSKNTAVITTTIPCDVYMAPSTIGAANLGMYYAGDTPLEKDDVVPFPELVVPLLFREWNDDSVDLDGSLWHRYIWEGHVTRNEPKHYDDDLQRHSNTGAVFVPGVGCTVNGLMDMKNIESASGSVYDTAGLHRSRDPGAGAFSPYHHAETRAAMDIAAGMELFADYGHDWIPHLPEAVWTLDETLDDAEEFLEDYVEWVNAKGDELSDKLADALWNLTAMEFPYDSKLLGALPQRRWSEVKQHFQQQQQQQQTSDSSSSSSSTVRHFIRQSGQRSLAWLQEHGVCQDHLRPGRSTVHQAGRGAFANRSLPKGTRVGYAPLIPIAKARYDVLKVQYPHYTKEDLIVNYSFGHRDSTVLLTPYGAMVNYINHDRKNANVRIQWPRHPPMPAHKPEWLWQSVDFLSHVQDTIGLAFEYVALRDIQEGEEIFMDYGEEWQEAWREHVRNWKPPPGAGTYVHSSEWKEPFLRTEAELESDPYPPNLQTLCLPSYTRNPVTGALQWVPLLDNGEETRDLFVYCDVLKRNVVDNDTIFEYTVRMYITKGEHHHHHHNNNNNSEEEVIVTRVPKQGVELVDKVRSADWHLENAFRHEIMIPDDMFPEAWKNRIKRSD